VVSLVLLDSLELPVFLAVPVPMALPVVKEIPALPGQQERPASRDSPGWVDWQEQWAYQELLVRLAVQDQQEVPGQKVSLV